MGVMLENNPGRTDDNRPSKSRISGALLHQVRMNIPDDLLKVADNSNNTSADRSSKSMASRILDQTLAWLSVAEFDMTLFRNSC